MTFAEVESALAALEARGARAFDRDGCDLVRRLIARGSVLPRPADAQILKRASAHLERVSARFERALAESSERLARAEQLRGALPTQRAAFERRELGSLGRALRRLERSPVLQRTAAGRVREQLERCAAEYEAALYDLRGQFLVARAVDEVPAHAGPYNPLRIATELLSRIGAVSPTYLTAQLRRLDELAIMLTLPEPPTAAGATLVPMPAPKRAARSKPKRRSRSQAGAR